MHDTSPYEFGKIVNSLERRWGIPSHVEMATDPFCAPTPFPPFRVPFSPHPTPFRHSSLFFIHSPHTGNKRNPNPRVATLGYQRGALCGPEQHVAWIVVRRRRSADGYDLHAAAASALLGKGATALTAQAVARPSPSLT